MSAFNSSIELYNFFRKTAQSFDCNLCFDDKQPEIEAMNKEGADRKPKCLCKLGTSCPCKEAQEEIEQDGKCYCEVFARMNK